MELAIAVVLIFPGASAHAAASTNKDAASVSALLDELSSTKDANRARELELRLRGGAAPETDDDVRKIEPQLASEDESHRRLGIALISNIKDPRLGGALLNLLQNQSKTLPPEQLKDLMRAPAKSPKLGQEQVLAILMLKLGELGTKDAIPLIRKYAQSEGGLQAVKTHAGSAAVQALARLKDEEFFGSDARERLRNRHVNFDDPKTKPWLMGTMTNDSDRQIRLLAGEAWVRNAANPEDADDVDFAFKLVDTSTADITNHERAFRRGVGLDVLAARVAKGHKDERILRKALEIAQAKGRWNKGNAAQILSYYDTPESLAALRTLLNDRSAGPESRAEAQKAIAKLTGEYPHFDGESYCDQHPKQIGGVTFPPKRKK